MARDVIAVGYLTLFGLVLSALASAATFYTWRHW